MEARPSRRPGRKPAVGDFEGLFSAPAKAGKVDDYSEIFGGFAESCSIPFLELPAEFDGGVSTARFRGGGFDYGEVFGRFGGGDFGVSCEELIVGKKRAEDFNGRAPDKAGFGQQVADVSQLPSERSGGEFVVSIENGQAFLDRDHPKHELRHFNMSYHKTSGGSTEENRSGMTHVTHLCAIPGFNFVVGAYSSENLKSDSIPEKTAFDLSHNANSNGTITDMKQHERCRSSSDNGTTEILVNELKDGKQLSTNSPASEDVSEDLRLHSRSSSYHSISSGDISCPDITFISVSGISLRTQPLQVPPPSRPPPKLANHCSHPKIKMHPDTKNDVDEGGLFRQRNNNRKHPAEIFSQPEAVEDNSTCFYDAELDASMAAAAMKEAMEQAQAKLKSARELMERKRDSFRSHKMLHKHDSNRFNGDGAAEEVKTLIGYKTEIMLEKEDQEINVLLKQDTQRDRRDTKTAVHRKDGHKLHESLNSTRDVPAEEVKSFLEDQTEKTLGKPDLKLNIFAEKDRQENIREFKIAVDHKDGHKLQKIIDCNRDGAVKEVKVIFEDKIEKPLAKEDRKISVFAEQDRWQHRREPEIAVDRKDGYKLYDSINCNGNEPAEKVKSISEDKTEITFTKEDQKINVFVEEDWQQDRREYKIGDDCKDGHKLYDSMNSNDDRAAEEAKALIEDKTEKTLGKEDHEINVFPEKDKQTNGRESKITVDHIDGHKLQNSMNCNGDGAAEEGKAFIGNKSVRILAEEDDKFNVFPGQHEQTLSRESNIAVDHKDGHKLHNSMNCNGDGSTEEVEAFVEVKTEINLGKEDQKTNGFAEQDRQKDRRESKIAIDHAEKESHSGANGCQLLGKNAISSPYSLEETGKCKVDKQNCELLNNNGNLIQEASIQEVTEQAEKKLNVTKEVDNDVQKIKVAETTNEYKRPRKLWAVNTSPEVEREKKLIADLIISQVSSVQEVSEQNCVENISNATKKLEVEGQRSKVAEGTYEPKRTRKLWAVNNSLEVENEKKIDADMMVGWEEEIKEILSAIRQVHVQEKSLNIQDAIFDYSQEEDTKSDEAQVVYPGEEDGATQKDVEAVVYQKNENNPEAFDHEVRGGAVYQYEEEDDQLEACRKVQKFEGNQNKYFVTCEPCKSQKVGKLFYNSNMEDENEDELKVPNESCMSEIGGKWKAASELSHQGEEHLAEYKMENSEKPTLVDAHPKNRPKEKSIGVQPASGLDQNHNGTNKVQVIFQKSEDFIEAQSAVALEKNQNDGNSARVVCQKPANKNVDAATRPTSLLEKKGRVRNRQRGVHDKEAEKVFEEKKEREREREKDRLAVERATHEAHERALTQAQERAERIAVERVTAEARQRALAEARGKAEKSSAEALKKSLADKASRDARLRAERAAVERATAEAWEHAVERTIVEKAVSDARKCATYSDVSRNERSQSAGSSGYSDCVSNGMSEGAGSELALRCKSRLERQQRTVERAAKALAEKNRRDILAQREQAERNRLAETLDADVKRWSNGKEGNLRALLSTLQYILGPERGWQPIPLTDVITAAALKKAYRKATLCVHPDKLQQRGASIQQKYICEKVFDLLKEAWNRFNLEEQ